MVSGVKRDDVVVMEAMMHFFLVRPSFLGVGNFENGVVALRYLIIKN